MWKIVKSWLTIFSRRLQIWFRWLWDCHQSRSRGTLSRDARACRQHSPRNSRRRSRWAVFRPLFASVWAGLLEPRAWAGAARRSRLGPLSARTNTSASKHLATLLIGFDKRKSVLWKFRFYPAGYFIRGGLNQGENGGRNFFRHCRFTP